MGKTRAPSARDAWPGSGHAARHALFCDSLYTLLAGQWVGNQGRVCAFEANPEIFRKLRKSVAVNGYDDRVSLYGCALYSEERTLDLHFTYEFSGGGSAFGSDDGEIYQSRQVTVPARTLDTLLAEVPQVEVMKIDVEGA